MREIIRAGAWIGFSDLVRELGGDPASILAAARIDPASLEQPDRYLPLRAFLECQEIAASRLGRPDFGLRLGQRDNISTLGPLAIAIVSAETARSAIEIASRYIHIQSPSYLLSLTPTPARKREFLGFEVRMRKSGDYRQNAERIAANIHTLLKRIGGDAYGLREVWLMHAPLSDKNVYRACFGHTPRFEQTAMGLVLDRDAIDAFLPGRSAILQSMSENFLRTLAPPADAPFSQQVSRLLRFMLLSGDCTPAQVAVALGVHERTLQRRLKAGAISFEQIKDDIRREQAEMLLSQRNISLSHIALTLGYNDSSAFTRSCRRWFGEPPSIVRARLLAGGQPSPADRTGRLHPLVVAKRLGISD